MLTPTDFKNLLTLINSPRLTINGSEAQPLAMLQWKLQRAIDEAEQVQQEPIEGHKNTEETDDDAGPAEQDSSRAA